ncbi:MAG: phosphotransferase family protein [Acidimicrobiia bacterium]|nr:phosphotransferase family protein [Acidimicrobiia bacterium]MDH5237021.1 phosphotransferase family protein [Acidimicrobiia bacterium]
MPEHPLDGHRQPLAEWLAARIGGADAVTIVGFDDPKSGYSAETTMLTATVTAGGAHRDHRFVLRRETPEPPVYPVQVPGTEVEIAVQYRVMEALTEAGGVALAPLVGYDDDPTVVGMPFFVMEFVDGQVPVEDPIYTSAGFFVDATPDQRRTMIDHGVATLASVHRVDWRAAGLDWLIPDDATPDATRQLDLWEDYTRRELDGRVHAHLDRAWDYLRAEQPTTTSPALSWGDPRPGNIIWNDFRPACVTDFEAAAIAPPEIDLGWWLMFDHWSHETMGQPRLPGEPTRDEQRERYYEALGLDLGDSTWFEVFAAARYCGIVVRVMNRLVDRGVMPADHTIWLENPASVCLSLLFPG